MPPKVKPTTQSAANTRGVSAIRGGRGARGGRSGGKGVRTTAASHADQEGVSTMSSAEVEAMKAELEKLRKASNAEAKKVAEATRKIGESFLNFSDDIDINLPSESRKRTADRLSEEMEEENSDFAGRTKHPRINLHLQQESQEQGDDLDEDEEALARSLPPVSTSSLPPVGPLQVRRSNVILSSDDVHQDYQGEC
jgi:hypothetical protein